MTTDPTRSLTYAEPTREVALASYSVLVCQHCGYSIDCDDRGWYYTNSDDRACDPKAANAACLAQHPELAVKAEQITEVFRAQLSEETGR